MENMTTRVAMAFCAGAGLDWNAMPFSNFDGAVSGQVTRLGALNGARQALHALAIPSDAMLEEGRIQCDTLDNGARRIWDGMIEAALSE